MRRTIKVTGPNAGRRIDAFLRQELASIPRGTLMKWLRKGVVRLNGKKAKPEAKLVEGDEITTPRLEGEGDCDGREAVVERGWARADGRSPITDGRAPIADRRLPKADGRAPIVDDRKPPAANRSPTSNNRSPIPTRRPPQLEIIYEDADILIVNKPAHLPAHAGTGHTDSLASRITTYLGAQNAPTGHKPGLAQRLDSGVSGLVPVGKHAAALRVMAAAVAADEVRKIYRGIVLGELAQAEGEIRLALRIDDEPMGNRPRVHPDPSGLPAHTTWRRVELLGGASVVDVEIHTGRTHQIRAHLRAIGHPLLGDPRYGNPAAEKKLAKGAAIDRPALHARQLLFKHPTTGAPITADAPLPQDMARVLAALRRR